MLEYAILIVLGRDWFCVVVRHRAKEKAKEKSDSAKGSSGARMPNLTVSVKTILSLVGLKGPGHQGRENCSLSTAPHVAVDFRARAPRPAPAPPVVEKTPPRYVGITSVWDSSTTYGPISPRSRRRCRNASQGRSGHSASNVSRCPIASLRHARLGH